MKPEYNSATELKQVFSAALEELLLEDERVVYLDADLMRCTATLPLWKQYPNRVFNAGIAEQNMIGVAAGLAKEGFIPFVHSFGAFSSRRVADQIFMSCAYAGTNVKIIGSDPGAIAQINGGTHAANEDVAILRSMPGVTIVDVSDGVMLPQVLRQAKEIPGVVYIRLPRCAVQQVYAPDTAITLGKAQLLKDGSDVAILACGIEVAEALEAARLLEGQGIHAMVMDVHTIQPLDIQAVIEAARRTGAVVTAENHNINGGLGSAVAECLCEHYPVKMVRVGNRRFGDVGPLRYLLDEYYQTGAAAIAQAARNLLEK